MVSVCYYMDRGWQGVFDGRLSSIGYGERGPAFIAWASALPETLKEAEALIVVERGSQSSKACNEACAPRGESIGYASLRRTRTLLRKVLVSNQEVRSRLGQAI